MVALRQRSGSVGSEVGESGFLLILGCTASPKPVCGGVRFPTVAGPCSGGLGCVAGCVDVPYGRSVASLDVEVGAMAGLHWGTPPAWGAGICPHPPGVH